MCGIAGVLNLGEATEPEEGLLRRMLGTIRHRGPDQFGIYRDSTCGLGSARLSILDLAGGQQPIGNETGSVWIVFNGEIFNYLELRGDLESRGHSFTTGTDTEVIVHLYEEFGVDGLARMNGQWAFALWDVPGQTLLLARDRVGVRPLFYTVQGNRLWFGSEIKAILADPEVSAQPDPAGFEQVFTFWSTRAPVTCFSGIHELPAGHYLVARQGRTTLTSYWRPPFGNPTRGPAEGRSVAEATEELRVLLTDAVRVRLRADVPVGAYLSGGLDSSVITALIRKSGISHLDTFSIAFADAGFDERGHQEQMARFLNTEHQVIEATHEQIGHTLAEAVWHTETPLTRSAPIPMLLLSRLVRSQGYKVVLTGEGADEFLAGYDIFKEAKIRRFWSRQPASRLRPRLLRRLYADIPGLQGASDGYLAAFFGQDLANTRSPIYSHALRWRNNRRNLRFFTNDFRAGFRPDPIAEVMDQLPHGFDEWEPLAQAQYLETTVFLSGYLLSAQGDRMGMANSVEGRFPFLDVRVMEFCGRLPARLKLRGLRDKYLLRAMARGLVPDAILNRPKRPYRAPVHRSFLHPTLRDATRELLSAETTRQAGMFEPEFVTRLHAKLEAGKPLGETEDMALIGVLSSHVWHRHFVAAPRRSAPLTDQDDVKVICRPAR